MSLFLLPIAIEAYFLMKERGWTKEKALRISYMRQRMLETKWHAHAVVQRRSTWSFWDLFRRNEREDEWPSLPTFEESREDLLLILVKLLSD